MGAFWGIRRGLLAVVLGALLPGVALAGDEPAMDELGLFSEVEPVAEEALADARGGAALPGGLDIEVTALMRVLADGEDVLSISGGLTAAGHGLVAQDMVLQSQNLPAGDRPILDNPMIVNALDNVSLEQYREITIHLQGVPGSGVASPMVPVVPSLTIPGIPKLYVY